MSSSDAQAAAKAWRNRNSDFQNSWNETGLSDEPTHAPPAITEEEYAAETTAFAGLVFPLGRITPDAAGEEAHAIKHVHVWDPTLEEPE